MNSRYEQIKARIFEAQSCLDTDVRMGILSPSIDRINGHLNAAWELAKEGASKGPDIMDLIEQLPSGLIVELKSERYGDNPTQYHLAVKGQRTTTVFLSVQGNRAMVVDVLARYVADQRRDTTNDQPED